MDDPDPVTAGNNLTYTINYGNTGSVDATTVVITDTVPTNTTFVSATGGGTESGGVVTWQIGTVSASGTGSVSFTVTVDSGIQATTVTNDTYNIDSTETSPISGIVVTTNVNQPPTADAGGPYSCNVGESMTLNGSGTDTDGTIASYAWDFDNDGQFDDSSQQNPTFNCTSAGVQTVSLQVTDDDGASATGTATVDVNALPVAEAGGPYSCDVGGSATLDGSTSADIDGTIQTYEWDLNNDGQFGDATGTTTTFSCTSAGVQTVGLRVTDDDSATATDTASVNVNIPPIAEAGGPYSCIEGEPITLSGSGTDSDGTIQSYAWDLDNDGQFDDSTQQNPSFTCSAPGTQTVGLQVTDNNGSTGTDTATVSIGGRPIAEAGGPYSCNVGDTVTLDGSNSTDIDGTIQTYEWDLDNDGQFDDATGPTTTFNCSTAGLQTVGLRVTDNDAATNTDTATVDVNAFPTAEAGGPYTCNEGSTVTLDGSGSTDTDGTIANYAWDLDNDGQFDDATGQTTTFSCATLGQFTVGLRVTDDDSATATDTATVDVNALPVAEAGGPYTCNEGATANLDGSGSTDSDGTILTYEWDLDNDGQFDDATGQTPTFNCTTPGQFPVGLRVTDDDSATATDTASVTVFEIGLNISKTALTQTGSSTSVRPGEQITYTASFLNNGQATVNTVVISDTIPANTTLVSGTISDGGTESSGIITWNISTLVAGASGTRTFTVQVDNGVSAGTIIGNTTYSIDSAETDPISGNPVNLNVVAPAITSLSPANAEQGETVTLTIQGSNTCWTSGNVTIDATRDSTMVSIMSGSITVDETQQTLSVSFPIDSAAPVGEWIVTVNDGGTSISSCQQLTTTFRVDIGLVAFLISAQPRSGQQGTTNLDVTIVGVNTTFTQGQSTVQFLLNGTPDSNITVNSVTLATDDSSTTEDESKTILTANIDIASGAALGPRDIRVSTSATKMLASLPETADGENLFSVTPAPETLDVDVRIVSPNDGAKVSGTTVPITAEVLISDFSRLIDVVFDVGGTEFARLTRRPFVATGNVDNFPPDTPITITVTVNASGVAPATASITVTPVTANADVGTDQDSEGRDRTRVVIAAGVGVQVVTPGGQTLMLASQVTTGLGNSTAVSVQVTEQGASDITIDGSALQDPGTGVNREPITGVNVDFLDVTDTSLGSDETQNVPTEVLLCYPDADDDGIVDGTTIPETTLIMFRDSDGDGDLDQQVSNAADVDTVQNCVTGTVPGFSGVGLLGSPPPPPSPPAPSGGTTVGGGSGGCFIATAAYGTPFAYDIDVLRDFRDRFMLHNSLGKVFVKTYYRYAPRPADFISRHDGLRAATRTVLKPVVFGAWMFMEKTGSAWTFLLLLGGLVGTIVTGRIRRSRKDPPGC